jgi:sec-independent protein translocase protein TatA
MTATGESFMGISIWQLLIILAIVLVLFGAKRLRNVGSDLGTAVKGFKNAVKEGEETTKTEQLSGKEGETIEGEATREKDKV